MSRGVAAGISMVASAALLCRPSEAHCSFPPAFSFGFGAFGSFVLTEACESAGGTGRATCSPLLGFGSPFRTAPESPYYGLSSGHLSVMARQRPVNLILLSKIQLPSGEVSVSLITVYHILQRVGFISRIILTPVRIAFRISSRPWIRSDPIKRYFSTLFRQGE
jgi:hypothetical protein